MGGFLFLGLAVWAVRGFGDIWDGGAWEMVFPTFFTVYFLLLGRFQPSSPRNGCSIVLLALPLSPLLLT